MRKRWHNKKFKSILITNGTKYLLAQFKKSEKSYKEL